MRRPVRRAISPIASTFGPTSVPSRRTSVNCTRTTPQLSTVAASSSASTAVSSFQPCTATLPSRASIATATAVGQRDTAACTASGRDTAAVPKITRSAPRSR
jgi:hypothetical protein